VISVSNPNLTNFLNLCDKKAAFSFSQKCINQHGLPEKMTMDKSGANKAAIDLVNLQLTLPFMFGGFYHRISTRQMKYLNNILEQDHRGVKRITDPMLGFKTIHSAEATIAGIELHRMLRKGQHQQSANMTIFEQFYELAA
jgi:putative transposase